VADHHDPGGRRHVLSAGPDTPPVFVRGRRRAERPVTTETRRRWSETRRNGGCVVIVDSGRRQHPEHPVDRVPGADRVAQALRTPVGDMRQHVERTGVHVRPAGEPEGVQAPA